MKSHPQFWCKYKYVVIDAGGYAWQSWYEKRINSSYLLLSTRVVEHAVELYTRHLG